MVQKMTLETFRDVFTRTAGNKWCKRRSGKHFETFLHGRFTWNASKKDARKISANFYTGGLQQMVQKTKRETFRDIFTRAVNNKWCKRRREENFSQFSFGRPGINCPKDDPGTISNYFYTGGPMAQKKTREEFWLISIRAANNKWCKRRSGNHFETFLHGRPTMNDAKEGTRRLLINLYTGGPQ